MRKEQTEVKDKGGARELEGVSERERERGGKEGGRADERSARSKREIMHSE